MRPIGRAPTGTLALTMTLACLSTPMLYAQQPTPRATLIAAAREIIAAARFCALVTVDDSGQPHARGMDPFEPDEDFTIWMGTNRHTRKVREIARDPRVTLYSSTTPLKRRAGGRRSGISSTPTVIASTCSSR